LGGWDFEKFDVAGEVPEKYIEGAGNRGIDGVTKTVDFVKKKCKSVNGNDE